LIYGVALSSSPQYHNRLLPTALIQRLGIGELGPLKVFGIGHQQAFHFLFGGVLLNDIPQHPPAFDQGHFGA
jgi:hypothetical protein